MKSHLKYLVLALLLVVGLSRISQSEGNCGCCPHCGCHDVTQVCRLVPDVKKVTKTVYSVVCEDACMLGKSKKCGAECVTDECTGCTKQQTIWQPACGRIVTKKKLRKETVTTEQPTFKCVVETVCDQCGKCCDR